MWPLWRDQLERRAPTAISIAASVVVVFGVIVPGLAGRGDGDSLVGLRMGFYWSLFWFGYVGLMFQMLDRRGLRVMRALPMPSRRLARGPGGSAARRGRCSWAGSPTPRSWPSTRLPGACWDRGRFRGP